LNIKRKEKKRHLALHTSDRENKGKRTKIRKADKMTGGVGRGSEFSKAEGTERQIQMLGEGESEKNRA